LHTPHVPPSLAQCLQYLQFLQALHGLLPVQVANDEPAITKASKVQTKAIGQNLLARMTTSWKDGQIVLSGTKRRNRISQVNED
jgi:hypothetical protein